MLEEKKISRKDFLVYAASLLGLFVISKIPKSVVPEKKPEDHYSNNAYGGTKSS